MPVVPADEVDYGVVAGEAFTRYSEGAALRSADGVHDRMVVGHQLTVRQVPADVHVEMAVHPFVPQHPLEDAHYGLRALVIRRDPGANQAVRGRQAFEHVDLDAFDRDEGLGRIGRGRTGAHDRHPQGARRHCRMVDWRFAATDGFGRMTLEITGVDVAEALQFRRQIILVVDRVDRTFLQAGAAVDAGRRVDVEHLGTVEAIGGACRPDAVDRTHRYTAGVFAAVLGDDVGHRTPQETQEETGDYAEIERAGWGAIRYRNNARATTSRCTSVAPSPSLLTRRSRNQRSSGSSVDRPSAPWICMQRSSTR